MKKLAAEWNLTIDDEFAAVNRPLSPAEINLLEADLESGGCRDDLVIWQHEGQRDLLDGHHRYRSCLALGVPFGVIAVALVSREEALAWIKTNQRARRNCTPEEISYLSGKRYEQEKADAHSRQGNANAKKRDAHDAHRDSSTTAERIGEEFDLDPATIRRNAAFARAADTIASNAGHEALAAILAGELGSKKDIERLADLPPDEQREAVAGGKSAVRGAVSRLSRPAAKPKPELQPPRLDLAGVKQAFLSLSEEDRMAFFREAFTSVTEEERMAILDWIDHASFAAVT